VTGTGLSVSNPVSRPYPQGVQRTPGRQVVDAPLPTDMAEIRTRRRARQRNHLREGWVLSDEIAALLADLGEAVATLPRPLGARVAIDLVVDGVHELVCVIVGLIAEANASGGASTRQAIADLAPRPRLPEITDTQILDGSWVGVLIKLSRPDDAPLADVLARALPPGEERLRGQPSASERVEAVVRDLDRLCGQMTRRTVTTGKRQRLPSMDEFNALQREKREAKRLTDLRYRAGVVPAPDMAEVAGRVATRFNPPRPEHLSPGASDYIDGGR
jgi:hypothetical protein